MPYLSFDKEGENKPIAILKTSDGSSKLVYISDKESKEMRTEASEIDFTDVDKRLKGNNTKKKIQIYDMIQKGVSKGIKPDDLLLPDLSVSDNIKELYKDIQDESGKIMKVNHESHFEVMPIIPDDKGSGRDCIYITGCSGSGKSWFARKYCEKYNTLFKGKRPIYLVSQLSQDDTLDNADCKINRIKLDSICDDPIDLNTGELKDCLLIFDDWDTIENTKERKYSDVIWKLLNDCLIEGRHFNISVIIISHYNTNGRKGRLILTECNKYVVYPHGSSQYALKFLLGHHVGVDSKEILQLGSLGRWVMLSKIYPKYLVSEHVVKLV